MRWAVLALLVSAAPAWACEVPVHPDAIEGSVAQGGGAVAWYESPTDAYGHDIMGEVRDADVLALIPALVAAVDGCDSIRIAAGDGHVYEDTAPRLVDVDGDGLPEVVAVRSSVTRGAQVVVYADDGQDIRILAATPYIGQRNRWLAPAAIGDLDGDGNVEIAYVDRPHLAKTLRIWRYADGDFREVASAGGVTNHAIGDEVIHGGLRDCGQGPEIVLSDATRARMLAVTYDGATIAARDIGRFTPAAAVDAVACR